MITDQELFQSGIKAHGKIKGTAGQSEELDKDFKIQKQPRRFFRVGKVFKVLWPELPGHSFEGVTVVTDMKYTSETIVTKIRWFVVVKEGRESCTCV